MLPKARRSDEPASSTDLESTRPVRPRTGFGLFWLGEGVSLLGNATSSVLISLLAVVHLHAGAGWMGALTAAAWLPWLVIGLPVGAWVDRLPPRTVMIAADLVAAGALTSIPIAWWLDALSLAQLLIVAFIGGAATVFFRPAYVKLIPLVVPDAVGTGQFPIERDGLGRPDRRSGLAGLLARLGSAATGILFDAPSFVVSAYCLWRIRIAGEESSGQPERRRAGRSERIRPASDWSRRTSRPVVHHHRRTVQLRADRLQCLAGAVLDPSAAAAGQEVGLLFMIGSSGGVLGALWSALVRRLAPDEPPRCCC